jgi:hypothetical protein
MLLKIDATKAIDVTREFLKQSYATLSFKNIILEGNAWIVEYNVGFLKDNIKKVRIDASNGKIIDCM